MTSTPATVVASPRLALLDVLRFVAALSVVVFHWFYNGIENGKIQTIDHTWVAIPAQYGYLGVYLFFLISGFVISISARGKSPARFVVGRLVRLYPAYWVAMLFTAAVAVFMGSTVMTVSLPQVLANLTMVSPLLGQPFIDGVYWTLALELAFYLMIFMLMLFGFRDRLDGFFPIWAAVIAVVAWFAPFLGLFAFFAGGSIIATSQRIGWNLARVVGLVVSVVTACHHILLQANQNESPVLLVVVVLAFFGVILLQTVPAVSQLKIPLSEQLGALTYPIYLLHAHIGYMIFANFATEANKWVLYGVTFGGLLVAAYLLRELVEIRAKTHWYTLFNYLVGRPVEKLTGALHGRRKTPATIAQ